MPKFLTDEQMKALEENQDSGFISDEQMSELESRVNRLKNPQYGPPEGVRDIGKFMQQRVGEAIEGVDKYNPLGSPLRAYLLARQQGKPFSEAVSAYTSGFGKKAPPASEVMAGYGVPTEKRIHLKPMGPFPDVKMSPADIAGAGFDFMTDPLTYAPIGSVGKVGKAIGTGLEKVAGKVAPKLGEFAADRAVKAAIGQSIAQERRLAGLPKGSINFEKMAAKRKEAGELMLENQDIPWFGKPADIAPRLQAKTEKTGEVLGEIGKIVDQIAPQGSVSGDDIAQKMLAYAETIPDTVGGNALKERIAKEAEIVAGRSLTFEEALKRKNMFKFEPQTPDMLVSNKDVTNKLYGIHTEAIDDAVDAASRASWIPEEAKSALEQFIPMKKQYGQYKNLAAASTERALKDASNRQISPTDYIAATMGGLGSGGDTVDKMLMAGAAGAGHKLIRERGSAFAARSANAVKNMLTKNPEKFQKWGQILSAAGASGYESLVVQHHLLMNSDPEYAKAVAESTMTPKEGPYKYAADALDASGLAQVGMAGIAIPLVVIRMFQKGNLKEAYNALRKLNPEESEETLMKAANQIREKYDPKSQAISRKLDFIKNQADDVPKIDEFDNLAGMLKKDPTMNNKATSSAYRKLDDFLYNAMPTEQYRMFQELIHSDKFDEAKMLAQKYLNKENK